MEDEDGKKRFGEPLESICETAVAHGPELFAYSKRSQYTEQRCSFPLFRYVVTSIWNVINRMVAIYCVGFDAVFSNKPIEQTRLTNTIFGKNNIHVCMHIYIYP